MQASDNEKNKVTNNNTTNEKTTRGKRWVEIGAFLILLITILVVMSHIMDPVRLKRPEVVNERETYITSALTEEEDTIDVAVLGDSEAMVLLDPEIMYGSEGISSYIIGQSGQRMCEAYYTLKMVSEKQQLKVVFFETDMMFPATGEFGEGLYTVNASMARAFPIFKFHGAWKEMLNLKEAPEMTHVRGFDKRDVVDPYTGDEYMNPTDEKANLLLFPKFFFGQICDLCKTKSIRLVLVSAPSPKNYNYPRHNTLTELAEKNGLDFIDFNMMKDEIGLDWQTDSLDGGDHVNYSGTEKMTKYLLRYLKENCDLPDRRSE